MYLLVLQWCDCFTKKISEFCLNLVLKRFYEKKNVTTTLNVFQCRYEWDESTSSITMFNGRKKFFIMVEQQYKIIYRTSLRIVFRKQRFISLIDWRNYDLSAFSYYLYRLTRHLQLPLISFLFFYILVDFRFTV